MSWHFSQALAAEYLGLTCWDGELYVQSKTIPTVRACLSKDRMTAFSRLSQFGMTFEPLTDDLGGELLTWYLEGFRAKRSVQQPEESILPRISGQECGALLPKSSRVRPLPKMFKDNQLSRPEKISLKWVTKPKHLPLARQTWVVTTFGKDFGYLHTPTTMANFAAPSMQKHKACKNFLKAFGRPTPANFEYLMNWPLGWTDLKPLEMDKFLQWRQQHGDF